MHRGYQNDMFQLKNSSAMSVARNIVSAVENRQAREMQEKERELAEKVSEATVAQIKHRFASDMETLQSRIKTQNQQAIEAAKDAKYLAQRQQNLIGV